MDLLEFSYDEAGECVAMKINLKPKRNLSSIEISKLKEVIDIQLARMVDASECECEIHRLLNFAKVRKQLSYKA